MLFKSNDKGFTLIEILIMVTIIAILAITAVGTYISTAENFGFLSDFNALVSDFKLARSYAISNVKMDSVANYGIRIERSDIDSVPTYSIMIFEDLKNSGTPFVYDNGIDTIIANTNTTFNTDFEIGIDSALVAESPISEPNTYYFYYTTGTNKFSSYLEIENGSTTLISSDTARYLELIFGAKDGSITRYLVISQISGLAESFRENNIKI